MTKSPVCGASLASRQISDSLTSGSSALFVVTCLDYRRTYVVYDRVSYFDTLFLEDWHIDVNWYSEPHLHASVYFFGYDVKVLNTFRHRKCSKVSSSLEKFLNLTCNSCSEIPRLIDFRLRILREGKAIVKRDSITTSSGIRMGYLSINEFSCHNRYVTRKLKLEKLQY